MKKRQQEQDVKDGPAGANPGYPVFQIAKALTTSQQHEDAATRDRAMEKILEWESVLRNILTGSVGYGHRAPIARVPVWATLKVVTGGFATGELLAGGQLQEHEKQLVESLADLQSIESGQERLTLNSHFLTDAGIALLRDWLRTGCYDIDVPEAGALMVVAWLVENGFAEDGRRLLSELSPFFSRLRFYPIPIEKPRRFGSRVHLQDVKKTLEDLRSIRPSNRVLAQKEAVQIWLPIYDRIVALFLETVENGWPCQRYPEDWTERATELLGEYEALRKKHTHCRKMERTNGHSAQIRKFLDKCAREPRGLTGREVGRIRLILNRYVAKRGIPDSPLCTEARRRQAVDVSAPTFYELGGIVVYRLRKYASDEGLDDLSDLGATVTKEEAAIFGVPEGITIPPSIQRKAQRCLNETIDGLVQRGLITSGETLARVLPQMTAELRAAGVIDPTLRQLYAAIYRAFRRRRSLLLLNLEKQVRIEELPWVGAIDRFRDESLSSRELARQTLEELTLVTLTSFPHAPVPNKLIQEFQALVTGADLDIPLVSELAADIFMGKFSDKFLESARTAADLLAGSLYETYYGIDYDEVTRISKGQRAEKGTWISQPTRTRSDTFAQMCASRAGVSLGSWDPATSGMIIEQQQILTTQNLAALYVGLNLSDALRNHLGEMAKRCFAWICKRQQIKAGRRHAQIIMLKNTAYAWRQMIFFLSLVPKNGIDEFLRWAADHLDGQTEEYRNRFLPALNGLALAAGGHSLDSDSARGFNARRFTGWSKATHWLLAHTQDQ